MKKIIYYLVWGMAGIILVLLMPDTFGAIFEWKDAHLTEILIVLLIVFAVSIVSMCIYNKIRYGTFLHHRCRQNVTEKVADEEDKKNIISNKSCARHESGL